ncbi:DNA-methyltransferase [Pontibacter amylolyticus]|uniref:site-specific DNA-methyltransferase (cytosine-N(4)-specific) n=1 Tax=Pontibacter amylolyticus TaxID=1424080 RepID=A0ABQ1W9M8_9BACT|nr:DNA methyltransferase [Pontibacter amylolyticus]GGG18231.1 hypothetical protein GCM10011323_23040 [Pontibacter amylolyticus]
MDSKTLLSILLHEFQVTLSTDWIPDKVIYNSSLELIESIGVNHAYSAAIRRKHLIRVINNKFSFNEDIYKKLYAYFAKEKGRTFNYHQKREIEFFLDDNNVIGLKEWARLKLNQKEYSEGFFSQLHAKTSDETVQLLNKHVLDNPDLSDDIFTSLFSAAIYYSFPEELVHKYFNKDCDADYKVRYFEHLITFHPQQIHRDKSLYYLVIDDALVNRFPNDDAFRNSLFQFISDCFATLSNHCHLGVLIKSSSTITQEVIWNLFGDIMLYSEKFINHKIKSGYFHPDKVRNQTLNGIPDLNEDKADFSEVNEGFVYKDCFILCSDEKLKEQEYKSYKDYSVLVLLEKNERDENLIPCPSCRSKNVRGNSYPILNVKSWECNNILCNDKSKYNRGKRYSLSSLIRQEAIDDEQNQINAASIQKWRLDVVNLTDYDLALEMLINHYTLVHDSIIVCNVDYASNYNHRHIESIDFPSIARQDYASRFYNMPFFNRFGIDSGAQATSHPLFEDISTVNNIEIYNGDSNVVMRQFEDNSLDGAVTSPPYYNAKDYSSWSNIYCYLQDMYVNAQEVYRLLKPGSIYLYNIFDYFDNENNVVFSAMGKKRLILGAYIIYLFKKIGFKLNGNIVWFKGEVEGKRNFNQGNMSPYYQAPHNSYEHIFIFSKGEVDDNILGKLPKILKSKPVIKMVKGKNTIGHDAPYPISIPNLLSTILPEDSKIIDPYGGTMTTALSAYNQGLSSISIDYDAKHCEIGLTRLVNQIYPKELLLFDKVN